MKKSISSIMAIAVLLASCQLSYAQQIGVSTPFQANSSSFFESFRTNFGFSLPAGTGAGSRVVGYLPGGQVVPNVTFSQNGFNTAIPAFGGFDPNSGLTGGFRRIGRNGGGFSLGFQFAQGSNRTSVTTTPSITIPNGGFGTISDGAIVPFVTGVTPVVGQDNAVTRGIASGQLRPFDPSKYKREYDPTISTTDNRVSSATISAPGLAEIRKRKASKEQFKDQEFLKILDAAVKAAESGDRTAARVQILKALRETDDSAQKRQLRDWLNKLKQR